MLKQNLMRMIKNMDRILLYVKAQRLQDKK
jgi:hypothetical protein